MTSFSTSRFTKLAFGKISLKQDIAMLFFRKGRSDTGIGESHSRGCADCGAAVDWLGTVFKLGLASERPLDERDV
jgi:hypothetical protein